MRPLAQNCLLRLSFGMNARCLLDTGYIIVFSIAIIISCPLPAIVVLLAVDSLGSGVHAQCVTDDECPEECLPIRLFLCERSYRGAG